MLIWKFLLSINPAYSTIKVNTCVTFACDDHIKFLLSRKRRLFLTSNRIHSKTPLCDILQISWKINYLLWPMSYLVMENHLSPNMNFTEEKQYVFSPCSVNAFLPDFVLSFMINFNFQHTIKTVHKERFPKIGQSTYFN